MRRFVSFLDLVRRLGFADSHPSGHTGCASGPDAREAGAEAAVAAHLLPARGGCACPHRGALERQEPAHEAGDQAEGEGDCGQVRSEIERLFLQRARLLKDSCTS